MKTSATFIICISVILTLKKQHLFQHEYDDTKKY